MDLQLYKTPEGIITAYPMEPGTARTYNERMRFLEFRKITQALVGVQKCDTSVGVPAKSATLSIAQRITENDIVLAYKGINDLEPLDPYDVPTVYKTTLPCAKQADTVVGAATTEAAKLVLTPGSVDEEPETDIPVVEMVATNVANKEFKKVLLVVDVYHGRKDIEQAEQVLRSLGVRDIVVFAIECANTPVSTCSKYVRMFVEDVVRRHSGFDGKVTLWSPTRAGLNMHIARCNICTQPQNVKDAVNKLILADATDGEIMRAAASLGATISKDTISAHRRFMPYLVDETVVQNIKQRAEDYALGIRAQGITAMEERIMSVRQDIELTQEKVKQEMWSTTIPQIIKRITEEAKTGEVPVRDLAYALDLVVKDAMLIQKAMIDPMSVLNGDSKVVKAKTVAEADDSKKISTLIDIMMQDGGM